MSKCSSLPVGVVLSLMLALAALLWNTSASAATITVTNTNDSGAGSLRQAMLSAGSGDTINITATGTIALESALPIIDKNLTISGPGAGSLTINGQDSHQVFFVQSGTVAIEDMTIADGLAKGGDGGDSAAGGGGGGLGAGGAVFVNSGADVTLQSVDLTGNAAQGGSGGNGENRVGGGGGGGGFHGNGGAGGDNYSYGGGGGGGFYGNGGSAVNDNAGGGGGGKTADGGDANHNTPGSGGGAEGGDGGYQSTLPDDGSTFGGGGGSGYEGNDGADGGDFGGGGGSGWNYPKKTGGNGGFGGGGGGAHINGDAGSGGFGGGDGGRARWGGGGGDALGGALFVRSGGSLTTIDCDLDGSSATGGAGGGGYMGSDGAQGDAAGAGAYLHSGTNLAAQVTSGSKTFGDAIGGSGSLTKTGAGKLTLSGTNNYSGGSTVSAGTLAGNTSSLQGNIANNAAVEFNQDTDGTYAGVMSDSGSLTKLGDGKVTLSGTNTYGGGTSVNGGTLGVGADANLGNAAGALSFNGGALQYSAGFTSARDVSLDAGGATFDTNGNDAELSGDIGGAGALTKSGAGKLTLSGANTYGGGTTVAAGTLAGSTASLQGNITNNAAVEFNQGADGTYAGVISGAGALTKSGAGKLTLSGANTYGGGTTVSAGALAGNTSSLQGNITNNAVVEFNQAADGAYAGAMSGAGSLTKSGAGKLTLSGANTYGGGTTVAAGTLAGNTSSLQGNITNNAAVEFDQAADGTYAGVISGAGSLTKSGAGKLTLSGNNTYTGQTTVDAGWLILNGTSVGTFDVNTGACLGGAGTVGNLNNGGAVAPGNSIGTLHVTGDYVHDASAAYELEINDSGKSDLIDVTGAATINGGTVDVQPETGTYTWGMQYTILEGDGGVTGRFDAVTGSIDDVRLSLIYNPLDVQLLLLPLYVTVARTPNQNAVATVLDQMAVSPTGDVAVVLGQLDSVICNPGSAAYFDQMGGELFGTTASVGVENTTRFLGTIGRRLRTMTGFQAAGGSGSARSFASNAFHGLDGALVRAQSPSWLAQAGSCWRPWVQGYGVSGSVHGDGNASGFNYGIGGMTVAVDRALDDCTRLGLVGGYGNSQVYLDGPAQRALVDSGQFAVYLQRRSCCRYLTGIFAYAHNSYDTTRRLAFGGLARTASADYDGDDFSFYLEGGRIFRWGSLQFQPYGALQYIGLRQHAFTETGAGSINLAVDAMQTDSFRGLLGSRLVWYTCPAPGRVVAPELRALWRHEFLDEGRLVGADFTGAPGNSFVVAGADLGRDAAVLGGGCSVYLGDRCSIFGSYDLLLNNTQVTHAGTGGLQFLW